MRKMFLICYIIFSIVLLSIVGFLSAVALNAFGGAIFYALAPVYVVFIFLILFYCEEDTLEDLRGCFYVCSGIVGLVITLLAIAAELSLVPSVCIFIALFIFAFLVEETRDIS